MAGSDFLRHGAGLVTADDVRAARQASPMRDAVDQAATAGKNDPRDGAALTLARVYAQRLDELAELAELAGYVDELLEADDLTGRQLLTKLKIKVDAVTGLGDLGPKLLAALAALGLTLASRSGPPARGETPNVPPAVDPAVAALAALSAEHGAAARQNRTAAVETPEG